jgi:cyclase
VGGGIKSLNDIRNLLNAGADKVSINTSAIENPNIIRESSKEFGSQCIVVAIDAKRNKNSWNVFTHGGRVATQLDAIQWAKKVNDLGAGELLITSMDEDGQQKGYDIPLLKTIEEKVTIPIIASGGAGNLEHMLEALTIGKCDAVLAASIFHYGKYTIKQVKDYLHSEDVSIRLI